MTTRHHESSGIVNSAPERVFEHLDDHTRLSAHMSKSSWMMGGGRMDVTTDAGRGQRVGSTVRLAGRAFGINLAVDEIVTQHEAPHRKAWDTVGTPRLLVIGAYRMGFALSPQQAGSNLTVWIDYALPASGLSRMLGRVFSGLYARWCTSSMVADAVQHFAPAAGTGVG